ncbi:LysR substrate binding domain [Mycobacteroides abscessus subsp. abscessus]|nr:LysR substrate binding domain [Mycobacteroides abscessus subsp. abscessus]
MFPFRKDRLVVIVPKDHPLADRETVSFADVLDEPFIGQAEHGAMAALLTHHARLAGKTLTYRVRLDSVDAVGRARSAAIRKVRLTDAWTIRQVVLCVRDPAHLSLPAQQLLAHLLQPPQPHPTPA